MAKARCLIIMWVILAWWNGNCKAMEITEKISRITRGREAAMMQMQDEDENSSSDENIIWGSLAAESRGTRSRIRGANHNVAFGTILYMGTRRDYEFYIAARVLLRSLARLAVDADLVVIASIDVPNRWARTMAAEGLRVVRVANIGSPLEGRPYFNGRFKYSLNKLYGWKLVEYERVIMLDADNLFLRAPSELFFCGSFCAVFIDPCIFHTGLFVLQPSNNVFEDIYRSISTGKDNFDGADQGFLTSYFADILDKPLFHPPPQSPTTNSTTITRFHGQYRLPLGYQMDASYYYIRLKWRVLCGPHSVITFPGASWLKPWYWWSWPVLPLGISWHSERFRTIGYTFESRILIAESFVYCAILVLTIAASLGFISFGMRDRLQRSWVRQDSAAGYMLRPLFIVFSFLLPMWAIPTTSHPFAGWGVSLLGAISMLAAFAVALQLHMTVVVAPWLLICTSLVVMAFPWYSNGIVRMLCIFGYAALSTPSLWWSLKSAACAVGSNQSGKGQSKRSISD